MSRPSASRPSLRAWPDRLVSPGVLLAAIVVVHAGGRIAAVCSPHKIDSFYYAVSAYRFWQSDADYADLVPDKPAGQALLTGWCFRLWPGRPSRLVLIPIESVFLLGAYAAFGLLVARLAGRQLALGFAFLFAAAQNLYNSLDSVTDGFNLNENYALLPMLLAVLAHLTVQKPVGRAILRGAAIGLALTIKQTSMGLLGLLAVHGGARALRRGGIRDGARAAALSLLGMAAAWTPLVLVLAGRGWTAGHLRDVTGLVARQTAAPVWRWPAGHKLWPLAPMAWCCALGLAAARGTGRHRATVLAAAFPARSVVGFAGAWLAIELLIVAAMSKPALHYYQLLVSPACLLAGLGMAGFRNRLRHAVPQQETGLWGWAVAGAACLAAGAVLPLAAEASKRLTLWDPQAEAREFAGRLQEGLGHIIPQWERP